MSWSKPNLKEYEFLEDVKTVYEDDYYDGPLSGHAWYQGKYCYYKLAVIDADGARIYDLFSMTRLETMIQLANRCLFQDIVGLHCTTGMNGKIDTGLDYKAFYNDDYVLHLRNKRVKCPNPDNLKLIGKFK
jgi:hypothetical protein